MPEQTLLPAFRFGVTLRAAGTGATLGDGAFQEVSGLEVEMEVKDVAEGGRNDALLRQVGRARYQPLVLKRGMFHGDGRVNRDLWAWLQAVVAGERPVRRYDGVVEVMSAAGEVVARWEFDRGLPARVRGPTLNGQTGDVAIEELHIAHEGLRLAD